jgi:acetylglutamate kinase
MLVVKYGGNGMAASPAGASDPVLREIAQLWKGGSPVVLVHGGGPQIDSALAERGIATERIEGQRRTDARTLEVTEAVLCGSVNKQLVREFLSLGLPAVGVSGEDGAMLVAERARASDGRDLGYVGDVVAVDVRLLHALASAGFLAVVAPLAVARDGGAAYNVNADVAAGAIAAALAARALVTITNVPRVLRNVEDARSGIARLTPEEAFTFAASDACKSSMKPKLVAAANAASRGAKAYICDAKPNAIASALAGDATIVSA